MTEEQAPDNRGIKKHRSPNYPYIGLKEALERAEQIQKVGGIHSVGFRSAMDAWNYKAGTTSSVIAALKSFGLIDVAGEGEKRQIRVTETARKILADHSERGELLKKAALSPPLYRDLWDYFHGQLPPSNKVISEYLVFDRHFNDRVVDRAIADFRDTINFANLSSSDIIEIDEDDSDSVNDYTNGEDFTEDDEMPDASENRPKKKKRPVEEGFEVEELNFKLAPDSRVSLVFTSKQKVTKEDFDLLMKMLELQKLAFPSKSDLRASLEELGNPYDEVDEDVKEYFSQKQAGE